MTRQKVIWHLTTGTPIEVTKDNHMAVRSIIIDFMNTQIRYGSPKDAETARIALRNIDEQFTPKLKRLIVNTL
jgi:hypothetical protein